MWSKTVLTSLDKFRENAQTFKKSGYRAGFKEECILHGLKKKGERKSRLKRLSISDKFVVFPIDNLELYMMFLVPIAQLELNPRRMEMSSALSHISA